jgi:hypothetical protein
MLKKLLIVLALSTLFGCAHERRIPTFKEAIDDNPNLESGIYNRTNGENVQVTVQSLKARIEELEKQLYDAHHETDYYKRQNDELQHENMTLRVRGNYQMERQSVNMQGFDNRNNPIYEKVTVPAEPPKAPEPPKVAQPVSLATPPVSAPVADAPKAEPAPKVADAPKSDAAKPAGDAPKVADQKPAPEQPKVADAKAPEAPKADAPKVADAKLAGN